MKDYNIVIPYQQASGAFVGNSLVSYWRTGFSGKSPRVNGHLWLRQNPYSASRLYARYGAMQRYVTRGGLPELGIPPSSGYLFDNSAETLMGFYYPYEGGFDNVPGTLSLCTEMAMIRCLSEAGNFSANLADMYRTRKEAVSMITKRVLQLGNAMLCLKRGNWRGMCGALGINLRRPRRSMRDVPGVWLEYIYGWKPLVEDVYSIVNKPYKEPYKICHGRKAMTGELNGKFGSTAQDSLFMTWKTMSTVKSHVRCKILADGTALPAASQLGVTNPSALAWEALPFSFVVDWFLPVGNYLELLTAVKGLTFTDATRTDHIHTTVDCSYLWTGLHQGYIPYAQEEFNIQPATAELRRELTSIMRGYVAMDLPTPTLKSPISLTHFANAMSLLTSAFKYHP